jgi:hypothetical protein
LWTIAERKLIPKPKVKPVPLPGSPEALAAKAEAESRPPGFMERLRKRMQERLEEMQQQAEGKRQIINRPEGAESPRPSAAERAQQRKKKKRK